MRRWSASLSLLTIAVAISVGVFLLLVDNSVVSDFGLRLKESHWFFTVWRLTIIAALVWVMPPLIARPRMNAIDTVTKGNTLVNRWRIRFGIWLLTVEVLFGQQVISFLFGLVIA